MNEVKSINEGVWWNKNKENGLIMEAEVDENLCKFSQCYG